MTNVIFGCGYLGLRVAQRWLHDGKTVMAVTRSERKGTQLATHGIEPLVLDMNAPFDLTHLSGLQTVLFAVGYDRSPDKSIREVYVDGLRNVLDALPNNVQRFIYISSTGVYGQRNGEWVDEDSPCIPTREGGQACLEAERTLLAHPTHDRAIVLRLAGIYGPGRIPKMKAILAGQSIAVPGQGYLNLIHVDDAGQAVLAAEQRATPPCTYVVADGCPVLRRDFYEEVARGLAARPPRFEDPSPTSSAAQRAASSKRIRADRMKQDLNVSLRYPSYESGLAQIVASELR